MSFHVYIVTVPANVFRRVYVCKLRGIGPYVWDVSICYLHIAPVVVKKLKIQARRLQEGTRKELLPGGLDLD